MTDANVAKIIEKLELSPHVEGGYFRETYRSKEKCSRDLPSRYKGPRSFCTAIYYLLKGDDFSAMHKVTSDEIFHHYDGCAVELLVLYPDGRGELKILGKDVLNGQCPQILVPKGSFQGLKPVEQDSFALLGATVSPGFEFADFYLGQKKELIEQYPNWSAHIEKLTRG